MPILEGINIMMSLKNQVSPYVANFSSYVRYLDEFLYSYTMADKHNQETNDHIPAILNGEASKVLNSIIPIKVRKQGGIFFTGHQLSNKIALRVRSLIEDGYSITDPACGAGNLLMSCASYMPIGKDIKETLEIWSDRLFGYDIYNEFIEAARFRLILLASSIHKKKNTPLTLPDFSKTLSGIQYGDTFINAPPKVKSNCVVVNPPFGHTIAPTDCTWASGKVQFAALFLERLINMSPIGQNIVAILPDVLRSGSRYIKWRKMVANCCSFLEIEIAGRFDKQTDVDVFILHLVTRRPDKYVSEWPKSGNDGTNRRNTLSDLFDIHIGPVVPYRDPRKGAWNSYVDCSSAPPWETVSKLPKRRFKGSSFTPPLVVIRRTSNPADKSRAIATIVNAPAPIAIENHLIVLKPKDNNLKTCRDLVERLKDHRTNTWLNNRIRCRHLTVSAIKELPWMDY
jgi:hypothetical protein